MSFSLLSTRLTTTVSKRLLTSLTIRSFSEIPNSGASTFHDDIDNSNHPVSAPGLKDILRVFLVPNGEKKENGYILFDSDKCDGSLIDPGVNGYKMLRAIETCQTNISKVFLTHAHKSHIACIGDIIQSFGDIPIYLHESDRTLFESNVPKEVLESNDLNLQFIKDQDSIEIAGHKGTAYHTPGHTKGSMCYHFGNFLFTGDTLLCNDVGPTNYEESNLDDLKASIKEKIFPLHSETTILPGHGAFTTVSSEVLYNKVVGKAAGKK